MKKTLLTGLFALTGCMHGGLTDNARWKSLDQAYVESTPDYTATYNKEGFTLYGFGDEKFYHLAFDSQSDECELTVTSRYNGAGPSINLYDAGCDGLIEKIETGISMVDLNPEIVTNEQVENYSRQVLGVYEKMSLGDVQEAWNKKFKK